MIHEPVVLPALMILLTGIFFTRPDIQKLCEDNTNIGILRRTFVHETFGHLVVTLFALFQLFELEIITGSVKLVILIAVLLALSVYIQKISYKPIKEYRTLTREAPVLGELQKKETTIEKIARIPDPKCPIGFSGIVLALIIVLFYLVSKTDLKKTWSKFQWNIFLLIPTILLAGVTIHGQLSGLISGIIVVLFLDFVKGNGFGFGFS